MRFTNLMLTLLIFIYLPTPTISQCNDGFGDLWQPSWATEPRDDLRCRLDNRCSKKPTNVKSEEYDTCCKCRSCVVWEGTEIDLYIEYISVLGRSLILSDQAPNETEVYKIEHTDSEMTEIPNNLCNWDNETNLEEMYPDDFDTIHEFWGNIVRLNFENNKIRYLPGLNCLVRLDTLNLRNNHLQHISNTTFNMLDRLRSIDFSGNFIQKIDPNILTSIHLQSLFYADFSHNVMTELDVSNMLSLYPFCQIDYQSNEITEIINENNFTLDLDETYGPGFVAMTDNLFEKWPDFKELFNLNSLSQIGKLFSFGFDFRGMPIICDCNLEPFMTLAKDIIETVWRDYMNVSCTAPPNLVGIPVHEVNQSLLICPLPADSDCQTPECTCVDKPNEDTLFIDCSNSGLTHWPKIPHSKFSKFISLNISGNQITKIENVSILQNISSLDISWNKLSEIDTAVAQLLENASYIDISGNPNLRDLPHSFQYHNVCSRHMRNLHIRCDCESMWIREWFKSKKCESYDHLFTCDIPEIGLKPAISFASVDLDCFSTVFPYVLHTLIAAAILALVIIGSLVFIFRYELLIIYLRARQKGRNTVIPMNNYDVFLSFNDSDDDVTEWILFSLEPQLIEAGYRVFLPSRDVLFGTERDDEIISVLAKSRNFLIILSDSYLKEVDQGMRSWTENEWKYGWNNFKADRSKNIVLVNFDHVSSFDILHPQIKAFLRVGCTVDFKNHNRNIMEETYKKLGKPLKIPIPGKHFENKNQKFSTYELFTIGFNEDKNIHFENENLHNENEKKIDRNNWEQEHANVLTEFKHIQRKCEPDQENGTYFSKESKITAIHAPTHLQKCLVRKCYACQHGIGEKDAKKG